ncbi:MAG: class I SAM-dependent methyltransferase [Clostridia bacterium]|nr:class I SAM-dependent methyltransferase [Clostridia bacterium]
MSERIKPGSVCIDGTAGRGRDTLFLSRLVGENGRVIAFDIQEEAVESTRALLSENDAKNAEVHLCCHSKMDEFANAESIDGIMFNFGWLPGGDHKAFSKGETSVAAIKKGLSLLKPGGVMTLCLYYGKENGTEERDTVLNHLKEIDSKAYSVFLGNFINRTSCPPMIVLIEKHP